MLTNHPVHQRLKQGTCAYSYILILLVVFRFLVENNMISHNPTLGVFTVLGTTRNAHAIRLFLKESCTCPSTSQCYHILAVKMSIGMEDLTSKKKINLTQLQHNTRPRNQKKAGRKAPHPGDHDVNPAPDSTESYRLDQRNEICKIYNFKVAVRKIRLTHCM